MEDVLPDRTDLGWGDFKKWIAVWIVVTGVFNLIIPGLIIIILGVRGTQILAASLFLLLFLLAFLPSMIIMYRVYRDRWYMRYKTFTADRTKVANIIEDILARRKMNYNRAEGGDKHRLDPGHRYSDIFLVSMSGGDRFPAQVAASGLIIRLRGTGKWTTLVELGPEKGRLAKTVIEIGRDIDHAMSERAK
jgi:hypothetical protein